MKALNMLYEHINERLSELNLTVRNQFYIILIRTQPTIGKTSTKIFIKIKK